MILFIFFELGIFLKNNRKIEYLLKYYSYSALIITIFSIGITIIKINPFYNRLYLVPNRLNGLIIDPNYFSILEISSLPYFLNNKKLSATKKIIYSLIILIGTIMSGSKTGFIILSVYIVYRFLKSILYSYKFNEYNKLLYLFIIFIFIILVYNSINDLIYYLNLYFPISNRVTSIFLNFNKSLNSGGSSRLYAWGNGIELIKLFPYTGVGKGNNSIIARILFSNGVIAHNTYIQIFVDWGLIIGISLFTYFIYKYFKVFKNYNTYVIEREILTIYLLGSLGISLDNSRMLWLIIGSILFFNNYMCYTDK
ncbi:O-antigen ligase family protein [uncultured Anaerococcus sp.]|uniref:O-antigen ligase family protein n=1 Tax=uncultured Anaerococcus sp. TaxID=293428 RepID=UPI00280ADCFB|nr:O-antigen ligase family protein [uncultured Anaerococcus sp.]